MATHKTCPIVDRCLSLGYKRWQAPPSLEELDYLSSLSKNLLSDLGYTRLRGFLVIEEMLYEVGRYYKLVQTGLDPDIDFRLESRSWHGLCESTKKLTRLMDEMHLYTSDLNLKVGQLDPSEDDTVRASRLKRMMYLAGRARSAIILFRPYLKNENVSVSRLPDRLISIYEDVYGFGYHSRFLCLIRSLMDVKL